MNIQQPKTEYPMAKENAATDRGWGGKKEEETKLTTKLATKFGNGDPIDRMDLMDDGLM